MNSSISKSSKASRLFTRQDATAMLSVVLLAVTVLVMVYGVQRFVNPPMPITMSVDEYVTSKTPKA